MQTPRLLLAALSGAFASLFLAPAAFGQGTLTPPGAPAPMFKTLDQIEARKPLGTPNVVTTSTIVIDEPGSYVLVGPITVASGNGITINASNVTLDLNGFTISSTAASASGSGVFSGGVLSENKNIMVRNGVIHSEETGGFRNGIYLAQEYLPLGGPSEYLRPLPGTTVENATVNSCGGYGIAAGTVVDSVVTNSRTLGIAATSVGDSRVSINEGKGVSAGIIYDSYILSTGSSGPVVNAKLVRHCVVDTAGATSLVPINAITAIGCVNIVSTQPSAIQSNLITNKYEMP